MGKILLFGILFFPFACFSDGIDPQILTVSKIRTSTGAEIATVLRKGAMNGPSGIETPSDYSLSQNYPNPFNPTTKIRFSIPKSGQVKLRVFDVQGREVTKLLDEVRSAGSHEVQFNGQNLASGVYFYSIEADGFRDQKKMILTK